jgi:hypothetical protein
MRMKSLELMTNLFSTDITFRFGIAVASIGVFVISREHVRKNRAKAMKIRQRIRKELEEASNLHAPTGSSSLNSS